MKYLFTIGLLATGSLSLLAQSKAKPKPTTVKKPAVAPAPAAASSLKTLTDSASYAIGVNIAQSMKKDLGDINTNIMMGAMKATFEGKKPLLDDDILMNVIMAYSEKAKEAEAKITIDAGRAFLARNKTQPGVTTTASGLQYIVLKEGTGEKPGPTDTAICNYRGSLLDSTEFDNSYDRGEPLTIPVSGVIKGWTEGLQLMSKGAKYKFFIPYELGYGLRGAPPTIPGGSVLVFELELVDVKK
ncbi:FKBP-type peptidyl-prolyl cis-trans isomerase [Niabella drilacis]|uniref:Peptidyl-prolyl cis-trans isomerase n=1 Tax=Niabella drilacis (strain DSM 25811 / CCM 8410 / CCUG 62505 / LMG 26954 / E90) TaxID=1285928 RepID=A0A1G6IYZ8_NIADE|nr:FKBP-type peptidyl-prolyl cis-trans isomerase [Niabella drilacis]SDC11583.1 FKBP-type peptidyl-prolyl cis-trans isomerase FklB [Niabella drilacis]